MPELLVRAGFLLPAQALAIRDAVIASGYVGKSPLVGTFEASRGFAITCTRAGVPEVRERFPFLTPFLDEVLQPRSYRRLWTVGERVLARLGELTPNAFYLNCLVIPAGAGVGPHIDATLGRAAAMPGVLPRVVSVLYLHQPPGTGGMLRLAREGQVVGEVRPQPGTLVHFRGELTHEVTALDDAPDGSERVSVVCEQYCFAEGVLGRVPTVAVRSGGKFRAVLEEVRRRPPPSFTLD